MSDERPKDSLLGRVYQVVLLLSVLGNGALAYLTFDNAQARERAELAKAELEQRLLIEQQSPRLEIFRLIFSARAFDSFASSGAAPPFMGDGATYRVIQNEHWLALREDIGADRALGGRIEFLVIANRGAAAVTELAAVGEAASYGALEPNSAILVPTRYSRPGRRAAPAREPAVLRYSFSFAGRQETREAPAPAPAAEAWTPTLGQGEGVAEEDGGVARAAPERESETRLDDLIPH